MCHNEIDGRFAIREGSIHTCGKVFALLHESFEETMTDNDKTNSLINAGRRAVKMLRDSTEPVYVLDSSGKLIFANEALAGWLQVSLGSLIGLDCHAALSSDQQPERFIASMLAPPSLCTEDVTFRKSLPADSERPASLIIGLSVGSNLPEWLCRILPQSPSVSHHVASPSEESLSQAAEVLTAIRKSYPHLDGLHILVGKSPEAKRCLAQCQLYLAGAPLGAQPLLISGPEGTGKSETARALFSHRLRQLGLPDRSGRIIPVNCQLMDAPLFRNVVEMISDLQPQTITLMVILERLETLAEAVQDMLLQALDRWPSILWVATSRLDHLGVMESSPQWKQISQFMATQHIHIAPLCDRIQDLPLLLEALLPRVLAEFHRVVPVRFSPEIMSLLSAYPWPGNIRELRQVLVHAVREATDGVVHISHLPLSVRTYPSKELHATDATCKFEFDAMMLDFEREWIQRAIAKFPRNRAAAADWLGITRSRLLRRLAQLGLESPSSPSRSSPNLQVPEHSNHPDDEIDFQEVEE